MGGDALAAPGLCAEGFCQGMAGIEDGLTGFFLRGHRKNNNLLRSDARRQHESVVIRVRHDERADEPGANTPTGRPRIFLAAGATGEVDVRRFGEVLPEEVTGAGLDGFAILDHGFDAQRLLRAREALALALLAFDDGNGEVVAHEGLIHVEHLRRLVERFVFGLVSGVPFLPEKLRSAQKDAGTHFPAHHITPLIDEQGEIAVTLHPARKGRADDGLAGGANNKRLRQFTGGHHLHAAVRLLHGFQPVVRDHGAFFGEAFNMRCFLLQIAQGNEQREVGVEVAGVFEHPVHLPLDVFPDAVAPGLDDHAAADFRILRHVGGLDDFLIPLREIIGAHGADGGLGFGRLGHGGWRGKKSAHSAAPPRSRKWRICRPQAHFTTAWPVTET